MVGVNISHTFLSDVSMWWPFCSTRPSSPQDGGFTTSPAEVIRDQLGVVEGLTWRGFAVLAFSTAVYAAAAGWQAGNLSIFGIVLAATGLITLCGVAAGGAFGFLFGIPRLLQQRSLRSDPSPPQQSSSNEAAKLTSGAQPYIRSNSNLEEISDWLTKIIVGLGLIHLSSVASYIGKYHAWLDGAFVFETAKPVGLSTMLLAVTFATIGMGFLLFYIETRTRITLLFLSTEAVSDNRPSEEQAQRVWRHQQFSNLEAARHSNIKTEEPIRADAAVKNKIPAASDSADQWAAWAASQARAGQLDDAAFGWRKAIERDTEKNAELHEKYAEVLQSLDRNTEALDHYRKARQLGGDEYRLLRRELIVALYVTAPEGFERALQAAKTLSAKFPESERDVWIKVWHLCALGQMHAWLLSKGDHAAAAALEPEAKELAEQIVKLVPDPNDEVRVFVRQLIDPRFDGDPQERDLVSFKPNQEIYGIITRDAP
jgi:tetratricopeptide (TPR) repeat protein